MSEELPREALSSAEAGRERTAHMIASVLLDYPPEDFHDQLQVIRLELDNVDGAVADEFEEFLNWADSQKLRDVEDLYVRTFDQKRKCNLYLSYYSAGDTRMRGSAILAFQQAFEAMGWKVSGGELPDYLPAVLELSARTGDELAEHLLAIHREGLEVLRAALESLDSPWSHVVNGLVLTLPELDEKAREAFNKLVLQGPPSELVGVQSLPFPITVGRQIDERV
ncbi:MAG: nitrate reductase molybdenum cofactor assembly chaperone [Actinomycetaceae bacterium]|nr:nitrate reductase molybdenum cofactor assembly chaperone [Actinomycetaceae bacterium]